ncbi:hypothetical protein BJ878DRAFT_538335 [Calycina marina]|uniref:F-box domain-containing protein n=1 Tax=Calycina marina TaxID=1763456 RepID=A0A9P7ZAL0_9HELO|nr:hypothetical protein BJ878DRAFT_538335 [Calycina marina]
MSNSSMSHTLHTLSDPPSLSTVPNELLLKIFSSLRQRDFMAIKSVNNRFRATLLEHAGPICTQIIRGHPFLNKTAQYLDAQIIDGWVVSQHPRFKRHEVHACNDQQIIKQKWESICSKDGHCHAKLLHIRLSHPGPQFLYYLEVMGSTVVQALRVKEYVKATADVRKVDTVFMEEHWEELETHEDTHFLGLLSY